jgi:acetoin utilization protein AcuB
MHLESIMTREVTMVSMDATLREIRHLFDSRRFHHVLVTDKHRVVGIISDRDLLRNISPFVDTPTERSMDAASLNRHAHQIMTRKLIAGTPTMSIATAAAVMLKHGISCLPVLNAQGGCVGIVTLGDMLRAAYAMRPGTEAPAASTPQRQAA